MVKMARILSCGEILLLVLNILLLAITVLADNADEKLNLMEGDIIGIAPSLLQHDAGSETASNKYMWPNKTVPYEFEEFYPKQLKRMFKWAIRHISRRTCIKFVPHSDEPDYIFVTAAKGCSSYLGRRGGAQRVSLAEICRKFGTFVHELLHAIGFPHEQSRSDRDKYVRIKWGNVRPGREHNFNRFEVGVSSPYDYNSVMHYSRTAFTNNGEETVVPRRWYAEIGQREGMSIGDIKEVNDLYCPEEKSEFEVENKDEYDYDEK